MANRSTRETSGIDGQSLAATLGEALRRRGWSCATAESCTGGLVGHLITTIAGSSDYFRGGVIAYANDVKIGLLGVSPDTLEAVGAVSRETAAQMAQGARARLNADVGISTTGIAGPGGATAHKPVGLIYVGVAAPESEQIRELRLQGDRVTNIYETASIALQMAIDLCSEARSGSDVTGME